MSQPQQLTILNPGTNKVDVYKCSDFQLGEFYLVDTPGFDDTHRTDTDVLIEVVAWLIMLMKERIPLTGIIYLHRVVDTRMSGSAMTNLRIFKRLCGEEFMPNVVLATTMWNMTDEQDAVGREAELIAKRDFWGSLIANGSRVYRQDNDKSSARKILGNLIVQRPASKKLLAIQKEMFEQGKSLHETAAGHAMWVELVKNRALYESSLERLTQELQKAQQENFDRQWQADIKAHEREIREKIGQIEADKQKLKVTREALLEHFEAQEVSEYDKWTRERDDQNRLVAQLDYELRLMNSRVRSEEEKQKLRRQLQDEQRRSEMLKWKIRQSQARCVLM